MAGRIVLALALAVAASCQRRVAERAPPATAVAAETATLRLAAWCAAGAAEPSALDVALSLRLDGTPVFRLDDTVYGSGGMAALIADAAAADERGALPLTRRMTSDGVLELAAHAAGGRVVTLRYRAASVHADERGARHGLRHDATGIGGLGAYFLVLPDAERVQRVRIEWAPPACGGTQTLSSFGAGPEASEAAGDLASLRLASYFVGRPRVFAADEAPGSVRSAWFGEPSFDPAVAAAWATRALAAERAFFADADPAPYVLFVRVLPAMGERSNGMGQPHSLLLAIGPQTPFGTRLQINIAHEMLHRWLGLRVRLAGREGTNFWFSEGFTVHYAALLMLRAGLLSPEAFLSELNGAAIRHFSNPRSAASNDEIARGFFDDDALSVVPYTRGALYAAELDAAIRRASRGARSLDTLLLDLARTAGTAGAELPASAFRAAVVRELGEPGGERFDAVIGRGATPDPASDAYGPCFARVPRAIARFELGFDERQSLEEPRMIRKLVPGSAAAQAGLHEGEPLVAVDSTFLFSDQPVAVTVQRAGADVVVRYLPAAPDAPRAGFVWVRVEGVPDDRCGSPP